MNIVSCGVDPMLGFGNVPSVTLYVENFEYPGDVVYEYKDHLYYHQREDGFTHFFAHKGEWIPTDNPLEFETKNLGGFGGAKHRTKVRQGENVVIVNVYGPWSSNWCYANTIMPKKVHDVSICYGVNNGWGGYQLETDFLEAVLPKGWTLKFEEKEDYWRDIELIYNGQCKPEWSDETINKLDRQYKTWYKEIKCLA